MFMDAPGQFERRSACAAAVDFCVVKVIVMTVVIDGVDKSVLCAPTWWKVVKGCVYKGVSPPFLHAPQDKV